MASLVALHNYHTAPNCYVRDPGLVLKSSLLLFNLAQFQRGYLTDVGTAMLSSKGDSIHSSSTRKKILWSKRLGMREMSGNPGSPNISCARLLGEKETESEGVLWVRLLYWWHRNGGTVNILHILNCSQSLDVLHFFVIDRPMWLEGCVFRTSQMKWVAVPHIEVRPLSKYLFFT